MRAKRGYKRQKAGIVEGKNFCVDFGKWLMRYFQTRTCRKTKVDKKILKEYEEESEE